MLMCSKTGDVKDYQADIWCDDCGLLIGTFSDEIIRDFSRTTDEIQINIKKSLIKLEEDLAWAERYAGC